jgi:hypothetical protein
LSKNLTFTCMVFFLRLVDQFISCSLGHEGQKSTVGFPLKKNRKSAAHTVMPGKGLPDAGIYLHSSARLNPMSVIGDRRKSSLDFRFSRATRSYTAS